MIKKIFFFFSIVFFLFFLFFLLILINLNKILNSSDFKHELYSFLKDRYHVQLKYKKINVNLRKGKIKLKNLYFRSAHYEVFVPDGYLKISLKKIIRFNFYPKEVAVKNIVFKNYLTKGNFSLKKFSNELNSFKPLYLKLSNGTIDYQLGSGWIIFKNVNLKLRIDNNQLLYEAVLSSSIFKKGDIKGRFNYKNLFWESSLDIRKLKLTKLEPLLNFGIFKTSIKQLRGEVVFENNTLNVGFTATDPYIFLKNSTFQGLLGGYVEGTLFLDKNGLSVSLNPVRLKVPKLKGYISIKKEKKYKLIAKIENLNISSIRSIILKLFPKNQSIKEVFNIVQKGNLYDLKVRSSGYSIKELFNVKNLVLSSSVNGGSITLNFLPFTITDIKGDLIFKKDSLGFKGSVLLNQNIIGEVKEFELGFTKKKPYLKLKGNFTGNAPVLKGILIGFSHKLDFLKDYRFKGQLIGDINLNGYLAKSDIRGILRLNLKDLIVKTPWYKYSLTIKKGTIIYDFRKVLLKNLEVYTHGGNAKDLTIFYVTNSSNMGIRINNATLYSSFIKDITKRYSILKTLFSKYNIGLHSIKIDFFNWRCNLKKLLNDKQQIIDRLKKQIKLEGTVFGLKARYYYKKTYFNFKSPEIIFSFNNGDLIIKKSQLKVDDSVFYFNGTLELNRIEIKGSGEIKQVLKKKIEVLFRISEKYSVNSPIKVKFFKLLYQNGTYYYIGNLVFSGNYIKIHLKKNKIITCNLNWTNEKTNMNLGFVNNGIITLKLRGRINLSDINNIFKNIRYKFKGLVRSNITLQVPLHKKGDLKSYLEYIIFNSKGYVEFKKVSINFPDNKTFYLNLKGKFFKDFLMVSNLLLNWKGFIIGGNLNLNKGQERIYLSGNLEGEVNLKGLSKNKRKAGFSVFKVFDNIPIIINLNLRIKELIFPTLHYISGLETKVFLNNVNKTLKVNIIKANFCGIKLHGFYEEDLNKHDLYIKAMPSKGDFLDLFSCLYPKEMPKVILEGPYKLSGCIYLEGNKDKLFKKGIGEIEIESKKGYIYRAPLLVRLFGFLSPIDLFKGKLPDLRSKLLFYDDLEIKGILENLKLKLDEVFLSATGFRLFGTGTVNLSNKKLKLIFYVSPFKTLDVILEKIPFLGKKILGKQKMLIYLPLEVVGTYEHYKIIPLHPSSIGKGIFDFIFRIFGISKEFYKKKQIMQKFENKWKKQKNEQGFKSP